jgi:hypothetical protein
MKKNLLLLIISLITCSCSFDNGYEIDFTNFKTIEKIDISNTKDSLNLLVIDNSWIFFDEYNQLKYNYLLWKNNQLLNRFDIIKIDVRHNNEGYRHVFYANRNAQQEIIDVFKLNTTLDSLTNFFLTKFTPTDVMNFRNANEFLNKNFDEYDTDYIRLLRDISTGNEKSYEKLGLMTKILSTTGMADYWSHEMVDATDLINRIEELKNISNRTRK